jgi:hypothetical protein
VRDIGLQSGGWVGAEGKLG